MGRLGIDKYAASLAANAVDFGYNELVRRRALRSKHSMAIVHPETGERVLFAYSSFLKSLVGLATRESHKLLELLWKHVTRREYTVRFKWNEGHIAFWCIRAPTDIFASDFERQLYRSTLVCAPLVGVDGWPSVALGGFPVLSVEHKLRLRVEAAE